MNQILVTFQINSQNYNQPYQTANLKLKINLQKQRSESIVQPGYPLPKMQRESLQRGCELRTDCTV